MASKGPIDVSDLIENSGNVHVRATGLIVVKGTFGGEITKVTLAQENVLPDSQRLFKGTWDTGWRLGRYTIEHEGVYGSGNSLLTGSTSVIIFPWPIVLPVLAVLAFFGFVMFRGRRQLARTVRVLMGRE